MVNIADLQDNVFNIPNCFRSLYKDAWYLALPLHYRISLKSDVDSVYLYKAPRTKGHPANGSYLSINKFFHDFNS